MHVVVHDFSVSDSRSPEVIHETRLVQISTKQLET